MSEAVDSLLSEAVAAKPEVQNGWFSTTPTDEMGKAYNSLRV